MCTSPSYNVSAAAPLPEALPTAETSSGDDGAVALDEYTRNLRRRGASSTVRNTAGAAGQGNSGLASSGTSQTFGG